MLVTLKRRLKSPHEKAGLPSSEKRIRKKENLLKTGCLQGDLCLHTPLLTSIFKILGFLNIKALLAYIYGASDRSNRVFGL